MKKLSLLLILGMFQCNFFVPEQAYRAYIAAEPSAEFMQRKYLYYTLDKGIIIPEIGHEVDRLNTFFAANNEVQEGECYASAAKISESVNPSLDHVKDDLASGLFYGGPVASLLAEIHANCQSSLDHLMQLWTVNTGYLISPSDDPVQRPDNLRVLPSGANLPELFAGHRDIVDAVGVLYFSRVHLDPAYNTGNDMPPCSTFYVGGGVAVAAGHCFGNFDLGSSKDAAYVKKLCNDSKIFFGATYGKLSPTTITSCKKVLNVKLKPWDYDYLVFEIEEPYPPVAIKMTKTDNAFANPYQIAILGHPRGRPLEFSGFCQLSGDYDESSTILSFRHDDLRSCAVQGGNSGGPAFSFHDGKVEAVGIVIAKGFMMRLDQVPYLKSHFDLN